MTTDWAWLSLLLVGLMVEGWLIATHRNTLSVRARNAARRYPWLPWLVIAGTAVLYGHFWLGWLW
jgi:hypothetical protein